MSTTSPEQPAPHAWLPADRVLRWLQLDPASDLAAVAEDCRCAAADYLEDQRRDLWTQPTLENGQPAFDAGDKLIQAGVLAAARLYARRSSPAGLASYGEFGAAEVLRIDPDVARLAGLGRFAPPKVG